MPSSHRTDIQVRFADTDAQGHLNNGSYAIYAEKVLGYVPCPLCMFQRVCIGALGIVFLIAGLHNVRGHGAKFYAFLVFLAAGAAIWVSGRHVWVQHQPPGTVPACGAPLHCIGVRCGSRPTPLPGARFSHGSCTSSGGMATSIMPISSP